MNMDDVTIVGGKIVQGILTKKVFEDDRKQYEIYKIMQWLYMICNREKPVKWYKPNSKGTVISFSMFKNVDELTKEIDKYIEHCKAIGEQYTIEKLDIFTEGVITIRDESLKEYYKQNNIK